MIVHSVEEVIRACRIVVGGLIAGLVLFSGVALAVAPLTPSPDPQITAAMLVMVLVMGVGCAAGYRVVRRSVIAEMRSRLPASAEGADPAALVTDCYRQLVIVRGGLTEGPGFLALMTYIVTGHMLALGAAGVAVILLGANFPSADEMRHLATGARAGSE